MPDTIQYVEEPLVVEYVEDNTQIVELIEVGPQGPPGPGGGSGAEWYEFEQNVASNNWLIPHGLGRLGVIAVIVDSSGTRVLTRIEEVDEDSIRSISNDPFSGKAYVLA